MRPGAEEPKRARAAASGAGGGVHSANDGGSTGPGGPLSVKQAEAGEGAPCLGNRRPRKSFQVTPADIKVL